jgi:formamidase
MRVLPILAVQSAPVPWDPGATLEKYETEVRNLLDDFPRTRLVIHPELYLEGIAPATVPYPTGRNDDVEAIPGPRTERLAALARELGVWLVPGSIYERGDDGIYNTAIAIAPDGSIRAKYRKVFPWRPFEKVAHGNEFVVFEIDGIGRAGLMICYDGWFPEVARHLAWMGAEVILHPSATTTSDRAQELVLARANAIVNGVYVVNVNVGGSPGAGGSIIVDPEGHELQVAGPGELFQTEALDLDAVTRVRTYGSVGMSFVWKQLAEEGPGIDLPLYGGSLRAAGLRAAAHRTSVEVEAEAAAARAKAASAERVVAG